MMNNIPRVEQLVGDECRICLKSCPEACQLFCNDGGIPEKLMAIAAVQVLEGDGLPVYICSACNHLLDVSYNFRCQIQNADERLRQILKLQIQPMLHNVKHVKDTIIIKDIADAISNVVCCKKDNHIEQNISSSHNIVVFNDTAVQSDVVINDSHISDSHKIQNTEIIESSEKDVLYGNLTDENREDILKIEAKNMLLKNLDDHSISKETIVLEMNTKSVTNCSDDEEKPLISRTTRQKCLHCIKSFATKFALQRHMNIHKHKTDAYVRYICVMCNKHFSNINKLKNHMIMCHEIQPPDDKASQDDRKANKVLAKVTRSGTMTDSTREEKKNFKFTCKVCSKQFIYQKSFLSHAKSHVEYNVNTLNDILDQSTNDVTSEQKDRMSTFRENESEEEEEEEDDDDSDLPIKSLQCTQCGKLFATKRNLKRHISTHSGLKFNCSTCGKGFSRIDKLKDHEQSKHKEEIFGNTDDEDDDEEDNESKINENSENRKKASLFYERHNRPHKCMLCPKAFAQAQSLANHVERHKRVKDTQKRFLCEKCSKCFAQSGSLVAHMRTHTGIKPYVCNVCSRAFTKSTYLQLHLRTHSGEKPYICQYCSRAFARANTLARHITMHTGEAKYHCNICTKSFRRLTSLNEHTYTHTGQRPYACKLCTKRYNNAGSLYAHTKKCKAQQLSNSSTTSAYAVSTTDNVPQQNDASMPLLIYSPRKLVEEAAVGQVVSTPQYMVTNVHNQKTVPANVIQSYTVEDPNMYNSKQFKNSYYAIYPNMQ
ncbi:hypothetical protein ALC62_01626 [Cyphomyrmex costatus]|uniref:Uncharacterized protein n=1 Tax=Cyphomyrmex costatus TaxID=456900 RepID=A0A195D4R8_9HYME|nr:hypothetical protein ALC62_01626 [Cyphomyrmex costatus]